MNEIDRDLVEDLIRDLERFWLYEPNIDGSIEDRKICPLKNYVGWENLKEIVRKG